MDGLLKIPAYQCLDRPFLFHPTPVPSSPLAIPTPRQFLYLFETSFPPHLWLQLLAHLGIIIYPGRPTSLFPKVSVPPPGYPSPGFFFLGPQQVSSREDSRKVFPSQTSQNTQALLSRTCACSPRAPCALVTCQPQATQINCPLVCVQPLGNMMSGSSLIYVLYRSDFSVSLWPAAFLQLYLIYRV